MAAIALLSNLGCTVNVSINNPHQYDSSTASSSQIACPSPEQAKSFLPKYGIENLVAELENPLDINMDVRSGKLRLDYVVCAYNSKSSHNKPIKISGHEESIRFLTGMAYDALAIYVKDKGKLELEAIINRQVEGGKEVTYINFDSKYIGSALHNQSNFILRVNFWNFSLIYNTVNVILHRRAEKNGWLKPPDSKDDSKSQDELKSIMINDFY